MISNDGFSVKYFSCPFPKAESLSYNITWNLRIQRSAQPCMYPGFRINSNCQCKLYVSNSGCKRKETTSISEMQRCWNVTKSENMFLVPSLQSREHITRVWSELQKPTIWMCVGRQGLQSFITSRRTVIPFRWKNADQELYWRIIERCYLSVSKCLVGKCRSSHLFPLKYTAHSSTVHH